MMLEVRPIPVELDADRLSDIGDTDRPEADRFLELAQPFIEPVGVFDELSPEDILPPNLTGMDWGPTIMAGLVVYTNAKDLPEPGHSLWDPLLTLAAGQVFEFLEYRIRLFLKPTRRKPSERLIPGCPALPRSVNTAIWSHFHPDHTYGLELTADGHFQCRAGAAFLYPTSELVFQSKCDTCALGGCPSRQALSS